MTLKQTVKMFKAVKAAHLVLGFSKHVLNFAITSGGEILPYNHFIPNPIRPQFWGLIIKILMLTLRTRPADNLEFHVIFSTAHLIG